jgi:hypothetical protein
LSNPGIDIDALQAVWVPYAIGERTQINVAMDWTEVTLRRGPPCGTLAGM